MYKVLFLDDEVNVLKALRRALRHSFFINGKEVEIHFDFLSNIGDALDKLKDFTYDVIISDYKMPIMTGVDFLAVALALQPSASRIILSGYTEKEGLIRAINEAKIYTFIEKPWKDIDVMDAIQKAIEHKIKEDLKTVTEKDLLLKQLEEEEPGITTVKYSPEGYIIIDDV